MEVSQVILRRRKNRCRGPRRYDGLHVVEQWLEAPPLSRTLCDSVAIESFCASDNADGALQRLSFATPANLQPSKVVEAGPGAHTHACHQHYWPGRAQVSPCTESPFALLSPPHRLSSGHQKPRIRAEANVPSLYIPKMPASSTSKINEAQPRGFWLIPVTGQYPFLVAHGASMPRWTLPAAKVETTRQAAHKASFLDWTPARLQALWAILTSIASRGRLGSITVIALTRSEPQQDEASRLPLYDPRIGDHLRVWCPLSSSLALRTFLSDITISKAPSSTRTNPQSFEADSETKWFRGCKLAWFGDVGEFQAVYYLTASLIVIRLAALTLTSRRSWRVLLYLLYFISTRQLASKNGAIADALRP